MSDLPQCPGGHGCTCCGSDCDCGCVSTCPVYLKWDKIYVPPRGKPAQSGEERAMSECHLCGVEDHLSDLEVCQLCECLTCEDCGCYREERDGEPVGFYCDDCVEEPALSGEE